MSQYGDGEYAEVYDTVDRKARKSHKCCACGETIAPGNQYTNVFYVFEGDPYTYKRCQRCQAIFKHLSSRIREDGDVDEFCDDALNCGHEYAERWNEDPPPEIAALAF